MAKKIDHSAAKAKKQKIILAVAGVLLLGLAAMQGPKLLKQGSTPAPEASAPQTVATPTPGAPATGGPVTQPPAGSPASGGRQVAVLAGVVIEGGGAPAAELGQLRSFSLFESKDPFVPQETEEGTSSGTAPTPEPKKAPADPGAADPTGGVTAVPVKAPAPPSEPPAPPVAPVESVEPVEPVPTHATVIVNGSPQALVPDDTFPKSDPVFVLASLKRKLAKVGVAGGSFAAGETVSLALDKPVTLVNDATGARYVVKLVYLGTAPEQVKSFTQPATQTPATQTPATQTPANQTPAK